MAIVLVGGTKGGTGKSTLAVNVAASMARQGRDVLLVDTDTKQGSTALWWNIRVKNRIDPQITMVSLDGDEVHASIRQQAPKYDDVVIDAGGYDSVELRSAMVVADLMLTPAKPGIFDFKALVILDKLVADTRIYNPKLVAKLVLNMMPTNPKSTDEATMRESITDLKVIKALDGIIRQRRSFYDSAAEGRAVIEATSKDKKACSELNEVIMEAFQ